MTGQRARYALRTLCGAALLCIWTGAAPVQAQDAPLSTIDPPQGPSTERYRDATAVQRVRTELAYSDDDRFVAGSDQRLRPARATRTERPDMQLRGGWGVALVVLLLLGALLIWMKFGGGGVLLSREPREIRAATTPDRWRLDAEAGTVDGRVLIARLRAMADRREALVQLLRHALLAASEICATRFARADTEREAFARLPAGWEHHDALAGVLRAAELAHYGGREVNDQMFNAALSQGEAILIARKGARHAG